MQKQIQVKQDRSFPFLFWIPVLWQTVMTQTKPKPLNIENAQIDVNCINMYGKIHQNEKGPIESESLNLLFPWLAAIFLSADNLDKQFGPRSGLTEHRS